MCQGGALTFPLLPLKMLNRSVSIQVRLPQQLSLRVEKRSEDLQFTRLGTIESDFQRSCNPEPHCGVLPSCSSFSTFTRKSCGHTSTAPSGSHTRGKHKLSTSSFGT